MANTFYIARHGTTENNAAGRLSGWIDTPLTPNGLEPTRKVIDKLAGVDFDAIYFSDLGRAFITAYEIARGLRFTKEILRLGGLREVNYGESLDHMQRRVFDAVGELNQKHKDASVLLVCHSGTMAALRASHLGHDFGTHNISKAYPHDYVGKFTFEDGFVTSFEEFTETDVASA